VRAAIHVVVAAGLAVSLRAQPSGLPTAAAVRTFTRAAQGEGKGDSSAIVLALDNRVRARWGDFESFPVSLVRRQDLTVFLTTPYMSYRRALIEHLRMREALTAIPWIGTAVVSVNPERIEAPDITRVTVTRDGRDVPPARTLLRPMQFSNGSGESATLHAGEVHFPLTAFAPGTAVSVTVHPATGEPFIANLEDGQLRLLK
jgi:hypothetical protein